MADLTPGQQRAMAYWGVVEYAARYHLPTADLWSAISDEADRLGLASPGVRVQDVSWLRGQAGGIVAASERLGRAADEHALDARYLASAPFGRDTAAQSGVPAYMVRFEHTFTRDGQQETEWRTSYFRGALPGTVGELREAIGLDAEELAAKYGVVHGGVAGLQAMRV